MNSAPVHLPGNIDDIKNQEFAKVTVSGRLDESKTLFFGQTNQGLWGFKIVTPLKMDDGRVLMLNRGWAPSEVRDELLKNPRPYDNKMEFTGIVRLVNRKGWFTPYNDSGKNFWFWYDLEAMKSATGLELLPLVVDAVGDPESGVKYPAPLKANIDIPNDHLEYAITWFALAIAVLVIYRIMRRGEESSGQA